MNLLDAFGMHGPFLVQHYAQRFMMVFFFSFPGVHFQLFFGGPGWTQHMYEYLDYGRKS